MSDFKIRPLERSDREWVAHFLDDRWGTTKIVSRGRGVDGHLLPGFIAERILPTAADADLPEDAPASADAEAVENVENIGLLTVNIVGKQCEITTLDSLEERKGVGSALVEAIEFWAREVGEIERLWLVTTNDNLAALKFWQKRGYELVTVHRKAIAAARRIKPQIPITGLHGIIIRDEIELEKRL